jgi:non-specific serine/threonine protein kinase
MRALEDCPFAVHVSDVRTNVVTGESRTVMTRAAGDLGHDAITDPKELAGLGYQMATALQTLHERTGYCHNDIKPANMLRSSDKKRVLLADFGSANDATIKSFVGSTLSFIAPEVLKAPHFEKNDSNRFKSDVFSLGMTLFSMALPEPESESESEPKPKRLPFVRLGDVITYNEERWKSLRDQIKLPDGELKDIIFQMLHPNPDKRPSMAEVRDALAPIVDKPAVAPPAVDEDEEYLEGVMRGIDDINN